MNLHDMEFPLFASSFPPLQTATRVNTLSWCADCAKFNFKGYDFILGQLSSALTRYNLAIIGRVVYNTSFACKTVFSLTLTGMANNREHEQIKSF